MEFFFRIPLHSPEHAPRDEIEILGLGHGFVVVADGRAEHAGLAVFVGPNACLRLVVGLAFRLPQSRRRRPELDRVIKFPLGRHKPRPEAFHDGMLGFEILDRVGIMRPVAGRLHADELEPFVGARAVAVHRAVNQNRGHAFAVRFEDSLHPFHVGHVGKAFVVHDDIEALGPIRIVIQRNLGVGCLAALLHDGPFHVGPRRDAFAEDQLLPVVIVAAAARHQQGLDGLGFFLTRIFFRRFFSLSL